MVGDNGASSHITYNDKYVYMRVAIDGQVIIADGNTISLKFQDLLDVIFHRSDGETTRKKTSVHIAPGLKHHLFSDD
jgi:hypothetical protein